MGRRRDESAGPARLRSGARQHGVPELHRGWEVHAPPKCHIADDSVPPDRLGWTYVALGGGSIHYGVTQGAWIDDATNLPLEVRTEEKPGTGDEAGRVDVPEPDPGSGPHEDTPEEALAKNSIASSRLKALQLGDASVPHGKIEKDYEADLINLFDST